MCTDTNSNQYWFTVGAILFKNTQSDSMCPINLIGYQLGERRNRNIEEIGGMVKM